MSQYKIEAGTAQHLGDQLTQQDCVGMFAGPKAPGYMMAVLADGAGSSADGAPAAQQVVRTARQNFETFSPLIETVEELLETIAREAHTLIQLNALASKREPYSTMVVLVIAPDMSAHWAHLGDSRLYRFQGPTFQEHTNDDAHIEKAIQAVRAAKGHSTPNVVVNVLGDGNTSFLTLSRYEGLKIGDSFMLCSDGLWRYVSADEMGAIVAANAPRPAAEKLIALARERGAGLNAGNCSMAIVRLVEGPKTVRKYTATPMINAF
jgi:serine/threonine protein phosphatase PrpC